MYISIQLEATMDTGASSTFLEIVCTSPGEIIMAIPGGGKRLVFWAPETLVKLAIPKKIALGAAMVRSLDQVIDTETGRVSGIGAAIVIRREGLDREGYVRLLAGTWISTPTRRSPVASAARLRMPMARSLNWICAFVR